MLIGILSVLKEIMQMVENDEFKYFGKIIKNRNRPVITSNGTVAFLNTRTTAVLFHKEGKVTPVKLRL
jgi:hypothetical protein